MRGRRGPRFGRELQATVNSSCWYILQDLPFPNHHYSNYCTMYMHDMRNQYSMVPAPSIWFSLHHVYAVKSRYYPQTIQEDLMIYRGPGFLATYDSAARPPPFLPPVSKMSLFLSLPVCRRSSLFQGSGGWRTGKIMRWQERLVLNKSFNTLWLKCVWSVCSRPT